MRTVIYGERSGFNDNCKAIRTYLPDELVKAFKAIGYDAFVLPRNLEELVV